MSIYIRAMEIGSRIVYKSTPVNDYWFLTCISSFDKHRMPHVFGYDTADVCHKTSVNRSDFNINTIGFCSILI